jgi:hypothetical protein
LHLSSNFIFRHSPLNSFLQSIHIICSLFIIIFFDVLFWTSLSNSPFNLFSFQNFYLFLPNDVLWVMTVTNLLKLLFYRLIRFAFRIQICRNQSFPSRFGSVIKVEISFSSTHSLF